MLKLITPATEEPVSLAEFKAHLHGTAECDDDADLTLKLTAAREHIEQFELRGRALVTSTWELRLSHWPDYIRLPLGNAQSVTSITYTDSAGMPHTVDAADYKLMSAYTPGATGDKTNDCGFACIVLAYGKSWPSATLDTGEPIVIRFVAGWDGAANVPYAIRAAILLAAAELYANREGALSDESLMGRKGVLLTAGTRRTIADLCGRYEDRRF
jgi:uncharacterized phiE125 gp8 family phage protein